ncbi:hypothetical protein AB0K20_15040 [Micromonospora matsumotoense]|uniref:hypothetical protein n=1 Tax=Micromonospora matsumotoense TaxID=121616 RepID=UPI003420A466
MQRPARRSALTPSGWTAVLTLSGLAAITACTGMGYLGLIAAALLMTTVLRIYLVRTRPAGSGPSARPIAVQHPVGDHGEFPAAPVQAGRHEAGHRAGAVAGARVADVQAVGVRLTTSG